MRSRLETLEWLYSLTEQALSEAPADRRSPLIAQMRGIAEDIASLGGDEAGEERNGLIDFQRALEERKSKASSPRRASR